MSTDSQSGLLDRAIEGDPLALERLLLDHYTPLTQWLQLEYRDSPQPWWEVDDIVQQTFAQVFRNIARFQQRGEGTFLAWIKTIATHQLRDAQRAGRRKKRGGDRRPLTEEEGSANRLIDAVIGDDRTPSKSVARREAVRAVQVTLAGLDEDYRRAIELRYFEGQSLEATAQVMGKTSGAVRGLLDRAKQKLREALQRASTYLSDA